MPIHPTAIVDRRAEISRLADIGPYAVIEGPVTIGARTRIYWHATVMGRTKIGEGCQIHPYAVVGGDPQDLSFDGRETRCTIGDGTIIRESATVHRGTTSENGTIIGKRCYLMAGAHVAHDCVVGEQVKIANGAMLGGHIQVGDIAFISGGAAIHQFVRVGELAMVGGNARAVMDVPPFFTLPHAGRCTGVNVVGLRRAGMTVEERNELRDAFRLLYRAGLPFSRAVEQLAGRVITGPGRRLLQFLQAPSRRGISGGGRRGPSDEV